MTPAKQALTVLLLANWFACLVHCQLEESRLTGAAERHGRVFQATSPSDGGEDCEVCDWVVTGGCQTSDSVVTAPDFALSLLSCLVEAAPQPKAVRVEHIRFGRDPPEPVKVIILFVCRTALPVRGPSLVS